MFNKTLFASTLAAAFTTVFAVSAHADYQFEVGAAYAKGDLTTAAGADADQDIFTLGGTYHLESVDTSKGPLTEAAFLDRASDVTLVYTFGEVDFDNTGDTDINNVAVSGRFVDKQSGWLVELGYEFDEGDGGGADSDGYTLRGGKYIADNTTLVFGWTYTEDDDNAESDEYSLQLEHLQQFAQGALKVEAAVGLVDSNFTDDVDLYSLGGTYYINNNLGFGAEFARLDSNVVELDQWTLFSELWVTEQVSVTLAYTEVEEDDSDSESDAIILAVTGRF